MTRQTLQWVARRNDVRYKLTFKQKATGDPINLTGWTIKFYIKETADIPDVDALVVKTITDISTPEQGVAYVNLTKDDTDRVGSFFYKINTIDSEANTKTFLMGQLPIYQA